MKYDFDKITDRKGTDCLKYDFAKERGRHEGILPLWVADMDFPTLPQVSERLRKITEHGIYGYSDAKEPYFEALLGWYEKHFSWKIQKEWLIKTPGVVFALAAAVRAYTKPGEAVLLQQPVYYPFSEVIADNERVIVNNPLKLIEGHYEIDFDDFEQKIRDNNVKLFLLCSPHNPVGRVWTEAELRRIVEICQKHHVLIFSDEIHSDLIMEGFKHTPTLKITGTKNIITAYAASKTFNLAGLRTSIVVIPDESIREKYMAQIRADEAAGLNLFGLPATEAAYTYGEDYLQELLAYIGANIQYAAEYIKENIPNVAVSRTEGTYFLWIDFRKTGLTPDEINRKLLEQAKVAGDLGGWFGKEGEGFIRLNLACPRSIVEEALKRIESVFGN